MPPPSLSMTTMRTGVATSRRAARPPMSWRRPRSPVTIVVGRPLACGGADPGGDQAVDAVGAAVAEEEGVGRRRRRGRPPGRGSACSRRCRRGRRRGGRRRARRCRAGSVIGPSPAELAPSIAACARRARRRASARGVRRGRSRLQPRRPARGQLGRVGAQDRRRPAGRLVPAAAGVDDDLVGAAGRQPGAQRLAGRHLAEAQDEVGHDRAGRSARRAAAGRRWRSRASGRGARSAAARSARRGSGSRRRGRGGRAARAARGRAGGRRRSRRRSRRRCAGDLVEQEGRGLEVDPA